MNNHLLKKESGAQKPADDDRNFELGGKWAYQQRTELRGIGVELSGEPKGWLRWKRKIKEDGDGLHPRPDFGRPCPVYLSLQNGVVISGVPSRHEIHGRRPDRPNAGRLYRRAID